LNRSASGLGVITLGRLAGVLFVLAISATLMKALARSPAQCSSASIGLARTIEIDTRGGPRFGQQQYPGKSLLRDGEVILTFDDGPHRTLTSPILDALDQHCTKATFFMVGQRALAHPDLVRDVSGRGHTVATHTWSHQNLGKIDPASARAEVELGISAVQRALGSPAAPFFRFPYLAYTSETHAHLAGRDTGIFSIDVDSYDFKTRSPTVVIRNVMRQLEEKRQGIILFHDIQPSTAGALATLLSELKARGFKVVHMIPRRGQTTLAEFDRRVGGGNLRHLASVPLSQRGIVSPAWEVQVYRGPTASPSAEQSNSATGLRRLRREGEDDWQRSIFRGW